jgi:hypothetical protein
MKTTSISEEGDIFSLFLSSNINEEEVLKQKPLNRLGWMVIGIEEDKLKL